MGKSFLPVILLFIVFSAAIFLSKNWLQGINADITGLLIANILVFLVTLLSYYFHNQALTKSTATGFVNSVYSGLMLKMFICIIAALIYIYVARPAVNKPLLFGTLGMYFIYNFTEVWIMMKRNKVQNNG